MQSRRVRTPIGNGDPNQDVVGTGLRVFGENVEITAVVEYAGIDQFQLRLVLSPAAIFIDESRVGKFCLWILVERLHVGMGRRRIEVVVTLFHVLAVIALRAGQPKEPRSEE